MAIMGLVGAVYESEAAPISDNIALLFNWTLEAEHQKEYTYGPELHAVLSGWSVVAEAYWTARKIRKKQAFVRLFIGKDKDMRCFIGQVELPELKQTKDINETEVKLQGAGRIIQEG